MSTSKSLKEDIILLRMLSAEPSGPVAYNLPDEQESSSSFSTSRSLSLQQERDIVDSLAFLSATSDKPEKVTAVCIEEVLGRDACIVRIASNAGNIDAGISGFKRLAMILESATSVCMLSFEETSRQMLLAATSMNRNRILSRLRSRHATKSQKNRNRPPLLTRLAAVLRLISTTDLSIKMHTILLDLETKVKGVSTQFTVLERTSTDVVKSGEIDGVVVNILNIMDEFPKEDDLEKIFGVIQNSGVFGPQGRISLISAISKLRKYCFACEFLVKAAKRLRIFKEILISQIKVRPPPPDVTRIADVSFVDALHRSTSTAGHVRPSKSELTGRFRVPLSHAQLEFQRQIETTSPKVHAEIQLVFFYESNLDLQPPRVICSSKSACFLCDLFIRLHGKFFVARTHGVLYSRWTLPNLDESSIDPTRRAALSALIQQFSIAIQNQIRLSMNILNPKRAHPNESVAVFPDWVNSKPHLAIDEALDSSGLQLSSHAIHDAQRPEPSGSAEGGRDENITPYDQSAKTNQPATTSENQLSIITKDTISKYPGKDSGTGQTIPSETVGTTKDRAEDLAEAGICPLENSAVLDGNERSKWRSKERGSAKPPRKRERHRRRSGGTLQASLARQPTKRKSGRPLPRRGVEKHAGREDRSHLRWSNRRHRQQRRLVKDPLQASQRVRSVLRQLIVICDLVSGCFGDA